MAGLTGVEPAIFALRPRPKITLHILKDFARNSRLKM